MPPDRPTFNTTRAIASHRPILKQPRATIPRKSCEKPCKKSPYVKITSAAPALPQPTAYEQGDTTTKPDICIEINQIAQPLQPLQLTYSYLSRTESTRIFQLRPPNHAREPVFIEKNNESLSITNIGTMIAYLSPPRR